MPQPLYEQSRPRTFSEVVGQDQAVRRIEVLRRRGLAGRAYWIAGQSGTGKTTLARLIAGEVADELNTEEWDAGRLSDKDIQEIERSLRCYRIGSKPGVAVIINEAHGLKSQVVRQLLVTLERIPSHAVWVFTTTFKGQLSLFDKSDDSSPLLSRCVCLTLNASGLELSFAVRAREIAQREGLDGRPIEDYIALAKACQCNLREMFCRIEAGEMMPS